MRHEDAMKARRKLITLLRNPDQWPENYEWNWLKGYAFRDGEKIYGCAKVLGELAGIFASSFQTDVQNALGLDFEGYHKIFMDFKPGADLMVIDGHRLVPTPETVAKYLEAA